MRYLMFVGAIAAMTAGLAVAQTTSPAPSASPPSSSASPGSAIGIVIRGKTRQT
jgi:hypothetical protein